jgi:hypothetical protein
MAASTYAFTAELWEWEGKAAWHFFSLPEDVTDQIDERHAADAGGFGSVKVEATIGSTSWRTSIFPDSKRGTFILPVKKAVRTAEGLADGATAELRLRVLI